MATCNVSTQATLSKRFYFGEGIKEFLDDDESKIIGELAITSRHDSNEETIESWSEEIRVMKSALQRYSERGSIFFEYNIPRLGKRADVIALIDNVVFVLEFKAMNDEFTREAYLQVWDYALDLKNFQLGSRDRKIIPIVVATKAPNSSCQYVLEHYEDDVYQPMLSNADKLEQYIGSVLDKLRPQQVFSAEDDFRWAKSGYEPTPTIVEAATALFNHQTVDDITKHDADLDTASKTIDKIIAESKQNKRKAICFVTGVPGAGKTLIGLQTAIRHFDPEHHEGAVYLSGNYPLVEVLQEALARDYVKMTRSELQPQRRKATRRRRLQRRKKQRARCSHSFR